MRTYWYLPCSLDLLTSKLTTRSANMMLYFKVSGALDSSVHADIPIACNPASPQNSRFRREQSSCALGPLEQMPQFS